MPVSYTHLDVYKRQAYVRFKPDTEERSTYLYRAYTKWCEDNLESVSYTHLDVYKRQKSSCRRV